MPITARETRPPIFNLLVAQGFSGQLGPSTTIRRLGVLADSGRQYTVFSYRNTFMASQVRHGRQAIVLVENGTRYLGAYDASMARCRVSRNTVLCRAYGTDDVQSFRLSQGLPPFRVLIDGEIVELHR